MGWYFHYTFPKKILKKILLYISFIFILLFFLIISTKVLVFSWTAAFSYLVAGFLLVIYIFFSLSHIINGKSSGLIYAFAQLILLGATVHDIVVANNPGTLEGNYILQYSVFLFILIHALMIIREWMLAAKDKVILAQKLEFVNANLENLVSERTKQLEERNKQIETQNKKIFEQNERLQNEVELKNRLFSIIGHDLRNPLSSITMFFDYLKLNPEASEKAEVINSTAEVVNNLTQMIENLLYWGRNQGNQLKLDIRENSLQTIISEVVKIFTESLRQKSIILNIEVSTDLKIRCDEPTMLIIIRNLVSNSIKFTDKGGTIDISATKPGNLPGKIKISIQDTGTGISEEKLQSIKQGLKTGSSFGTAREKGTGLGLSICRDLTIANNGSIDFTSEEGRGTRVELMFPSA